MAQISPITRGRAKPTGGRGETLVWYLMRISGVALFVLALSHFSITHFIYDPAEQTAEWIAQNRWNEVLWRSLDWLMLMMVLLHSTLGMRTVIGDVIRAPRARMVTLAGLYLLSALLFVLGTLVVATLPGIGGTGE
jgi:succinate dehydrogenase / fumarate reductase membrane anchor subunit